MTELPSVPPMEEHRENWGSRAGFVLAAVGSAVGLGNLWGFPYKVYDNGGGAFLIPYLLAMILIGIPLLILEFSLGHMTQRAAPNAYRGINRKTEPIGWWGILLGFVIITYYPVILAWCLNYLGFCLQGIANGGELPWAAQGLEGVEKAGEFFKMSYLNVWSAEDEAAGIKAWALGPLVSRISISLVIVWVLMYLCIFRGVKLVSNVVLWTVPLPWVMLLILTIRGLTLPGAQEGLNFYLEPDWTMLAQPQTWRWGFGQMFFSMSLAFGVMITYASFLHRKSDINNNAAIIGLADVGTSFVAGLAVFATLGAMAFATAQAGQPVPVEEVVTGGPGLSFVAFPYALAQLPGSAWFGAVFFIALLTLGIDSAFSITESVLASLVDKTGWNRGATLIGMSLVGLAMGLVYCTRGGVEWLGTIDEFINGPLGGIALLGLLEAVTVGWAYRIGRLREHANERSDWKLGVWWDWIIRYFAPIVLSMLFAWSLLETTAKDFLHDDDKDLYLPGLVGLIIAIAVPVISVILSLIPSPGADTHAAHVGQRRKGRRIGAVGLLLALAAFALAGWGYQLAHKVDVRGSKFIAKAIDADPVLRDTLPKELQDASRMAWLVLIAAGAAALAATGIGGITVRSAERARRRPSGLARSSAGLGVMVLGASAGFLLAAQLRMNQARGVVAEPGPEPVAVATAPAAASPQPELLPVSYLVLTMMVLLLVFGLGWCFYRAIKASSEADQQQLPEGLDEED